MLRVAVCCLDTQKFTSVTKSIAQTQTSFDVFYGFQKYFDLGDPPHPMTHVTGHISRSLMSVSDLMSPHLKPPTSSHVTALTLCPDVCLFEWPGLCNSFDIAAADSQRGARSNLGN